LLNNFLILESATLREALLQIDANHHGIILTTNLSGAVVGLATDGDIRRKLLEGVSLDEPIATCANTEFIWVTPDTSREMLLKKLDHRTKVIPILDADRRLTGIVSSDHLPVQAEEPVYARARSPVRISFGGGGSDLTHYFSSEGGAVINTASCD
jgi:D-glycero-alpha-D-manno-heptose-7-phosphate kinase